VSASVIHGDCLAVMPTLDAESVDAIVCDPPYSLNFMGRDWDKAIPGPDYWREALRVAKPGAHLVAFGGSRTFHRLACAIEDAGWEIRDTLSWLYGSGFPKSLDVSKALDKRVDWTGLHALQGKVREARKALGISQSEAARRVGLIGPGESLGGGGFMWYETGMRVPTREQYARLKAELRLDDECDEAFESAEREVIGHSTAQNGAGWAAQGLAGYKPEFDITAPATDAAKQWAGWGTALKPGWEPIILARKPLAGTVAATVARYGTGALNIDGCRIGHSEPVQVTARTAPKFGGTTYAKDDYSITMPCGDLAGPAAAGRWPANIVLGCDCEIQRADTRGFLSRESEAAMNTVTEGLEIQAPQSCNRDGVVSTHRPDCAVRLLDEQSGERKSGSRKAGDYRRLGGHGRYGEWDEGPMPAIEGSSGGVSRFFYTAKASRREREAGLEGMPQGKSGTWGGDEDDLSAGKKLVLPRANGHPTVKPLALMRWLCRLVTPPGGLILDPFTGSGSTGCAAVLEGFRFTGIEQSEEYCEIARRRIAHWAKVAADTPPELEVA
jgi:transcriptional regulator with XRE-family HTH domain